MKLLAIECPVEGVGDRDFTPELLAAEAARVWQLYQSGSVRELYFRDDEDSAVLVLECADVQAAGRLLSSLPLAAAGLIRFEVLPLRAYPGFGRLFAEKQPSGR